MSWKKVKLGELCIIEKGSIGIKKAIPGDYPLVVTSEDRKSHNEFQFDEEAVIIPLVSSTGHGHKSLRRIHYQTGKFALGSILCAVIPKDKTILNAEYLFRYLDLNKEDELVSRMKGMANVTLPIKEIAQIEIPIPSIEEQRKFVEAFSELENNNEFLSTELSHQLSLVKKLRQQFLQDAVQGKLLSELGEKGLKDDKIKTHILQSNNPKNHNSDNGHELLKKIKAALRQAQGDKKGKKQKELPPIKPEEIPFDIPENWVWCRLGEIAVGLTYGTSEKADIIGEIPVLRMGNITTEGEILYSNLKYVSSKISDLPKLYLQNGDLVFNRTNSYELVGKSAVFENSEPYTLASYLIRVRFSNFIHSKFIASYINSKVCRETQLEPQIIQQNGQANFNGTKLSNILVPLPPLSEQTRIVQKLDELMHYCNELEASIKQSEAQNEKLLQQVLREALRQEPVGEEV